jgi:hypothetical protein
MGEARHEITEAMRDLRAVGCDLLTITQYLRPTPRHHPVERWVKPEEFVELREEALALGFAGVMSGPLVRSSYRAGRLYAQAIEHRAGLRPSRTWPHGQSHRPHTHPSPRQYRKNRIAGEILSGFCGW